MNGKKPAYLGHHRWHGYNEIPLGKKRPLFLPFDTSLRDTEIHFYFLTFYNMTRYRKEKNRVMDYTIPLTDRILLLLSHQDSPVSLHPRPMQRPRQKKVASLLQWQITNEIRDYLRLLLIIYIYVCVITFINDNAVT